MASQYNPLEALTAASLDVYNEQSKSQANMFTFSSIGDLAKALIYAAEALHTRGAIRHIVGVIQMEIVNTDLITTSDLWVSMIENWGEVNKEYNHCTGIPLEECFLKMSKYMWRMFHAMRLIWENHLPADAKSGLVEFEGTFRNPEHVMKMWLDYKKGGKKAVNKHKLDVGAFLGQLGCDEPVAGKQFSPTCISKINDKVNAYNKKLAGLVTD